tara:strand:+ start:193 stop:747 length:555 start_codon:yes stop_codon:yes gene_type:complete
MDFVLNITMFPALLALDERRIARRGHFLCPSCITVPPVDEPLILEEAVRSRSSTFTPNNFAAIKEEAGLFEQFMGKFGRAVVHPLSQTFGIIFFLLLASYMAVSSKDAVVGIAIKDVVPDDSYIVDFFDFMGEHWSGDNTNALQVILKNVNWGDEATVNKTMVYFAEVSERSENCYRHNGYIHY